MLRTEICITTCIILQVVPTEHHAIRKMADKKRKEVKIISIQEIVNNKARQSIFCIVLEEACRQWCAFIDATPERKDGEGFAEFFFEIFSEKEEEYLEQARSVDQ